MNGDLFAQRIRNPVYLPRRSIHRRLRPLLLDQHYRSPQHHKDVADDLVQRLTPSRYTNGQYRQRIHFTSFMDNFTFQIGSMY